MTRASDAEREAVVARLRNAAGEGRLTVDELDERIDAAYAAATRAELEPLTADLPDSAMPTATTAAPPEGAPPRTAPSLVLGILGGGDRRGRWRVPERMTVVNVLGGADLDLREATLEDDDTELTIITLIGGGDIIAPSSVAVELSGFTLIGGDDVKREGDPPPPGAPVVRVRSFGLIGGTDVKDRGRR